jgi:hypothetical protein
VALCTKFESLKYALFIVCALIFWIKYTRTHRKFVVSSLIYRIDIEIISLRLKFSKTKIFLLLACIFFSKMVKLPKLITWFLSWYDNVNSPRNQVCIPQFSVVCSIHRRSNGEVVNQLRNRFAQIGHWSGMWTCSCFLMSVIKLWVQNCSFICSRVPLQKLMISKQILKGLAMECT